RKKQNHIKSDISTLADKFFHFASEDEKHVHFDREPKQLHGRMNEGISREAPDLAASQHTSTIEHHEIEQTAAASCDEETGHDRKGDMDADKNRRDIHRKTTHPRDRPIIVGSGHPEHTQ